MTTNRDPAAGPPSTIDDTLLDQITRNLMTATAGVATPGPAAGVAAPPTVAVPHMAEGWPVPGQAITDGGTSLGRAFATNPGTGGGERLGVDTLDTARNASSVAAPAILSPVAPLLVQLSSSSTAPVSVSPFDDATLRQAVADLPGALAAAAYQTATAALSGTEAGMAAAPLNVEILDGSLPRLFDESGVYSRSAPAAPSGYYFLAPSSVPAQTTMAPALYRRIFDVADIRRDFPILQERINGNQLVWLDNAATTQKPKAVIDRLVYYYEHEYSNVHRGAHTLAARSTEAYEDARERMQRFLGAGSPSEIVFVRGTTEAINLVAGSFGRKFIGAGDEIVLTTLEHHSNIVPWQFLAKQVGAAIRVVPVTDRGEVLLNDFERTLSTHTRLVAVTHVSNALGSILPVREMIQIAHRYGARVLIDGAQAVSHFLVDVQQLDADFYVLSGHKMFGPSAIGVLYGKRALLDEMPPWQGGGNMIQRVTFENSTFADPPARFEAGTAALGPAVGLGAAAEYLQRIGMDNVAAHERELIAYATEALGRIPGVRLIGTASERAGALSFVTDQIPVEEMGQILNQDGIAVRAGHHCAQPTMDRFGVTGTVRPSLALYNTHDEIDRLAQAVRHALQR